MKTSPVFKKLNQGAARPLIMGIINAAPDSFYADSRFLTTKQALDRARRLSREGADIIDIGGESTRPGSDFISLQEELDRVLPILEALGSDFPIPISIDTSKAGVARQARKLGASILNDVSALRWDPQMTQEAICFEAVILMHCGGDNPKTMQNHPAYGDVFLEVQSFLEERKRAFISAGGNPERVFLDPGIGFGKTLEHNLILLKRIGELAALAPIALGVSRKGFIGKINEDGGPQDRLEGSLAAACWAASQSVQILRVHDVLETKRALKVWRAIGAARFN